MHVVSRNVQTRGIIGTRVSVPNLYVVKRSSLIIKSRHLFAFTNRDNSRTIKVLFALAILCSTILRAREAEVLAVIGNGGSKAFKPCVKPKRAALAAILALAIVARIHIFPILLPYSDLIDINRRAIFTFSHLWCARA